MPDKVPNKSELAVLKLLSEDGSMTRLELAEKIGLTESGIKKILANLKTAGWIVRRGGNKTGSWIVNYKAE